MTGRQYMTKYWSDSQASLVESPSCHNSFSLDLDDHKNEWSRHRSFLYGCDRSPEIQFLKLRIQKSKFKTNRLIRNNDLEILSPGIRLRVKKD